MDSDSDSDSHFINFQIFQISYIKKIIAFSYNCIIIAKWQLINAVLFQKDCHLQLKNVV